MIRTFAVNTKFELITTLTVPELIHGNYIWYWIDFDQPNKDEVKLLADPLNFHPLAIEDCLHFLQRPKLDYYDNHTFFVIQAINPLNFDKEEVDIFLGENFIVTFHHEESKEIDKVMERLSAAFSIDNWDPTKIFHFLMDKIVDNYFPLVNSIEDHLIKIDENFEKKSMEILLNDLFTTRRQLLTIRQVISPMRDLVYRMLNSTRLTNIERQKKYFANIHDHLLKLSEMVEASREFTTDIRDSYISLNSHQTNRVMRVLTVITTIFMPLTFIAGIYGMNFEYMPELTWKHGYFDALTLMFLIGAGMYIWFRKKGWFK
ncbi:magnesium and cobalt transport protein CorA [Peribacillus saganii]|uniref:Magnesium transport protein CorA n=1 Tax=Peribacillus saganii TaxID=2303992 RepID=A0A372LAI9_9BACI|nr:magnesium/cobalt transporter CorA [Peribacillus saganii]RFU62714.1 magnesium and cobalt transport protein CorA [Peribacillus saganii]